MTILNIYGRDCIPPVQLSIASWNIIDREMVKTREDLNLARMLELDQQTLARDQAAENLMNSWKANKAVFDRDRQLRTKQLEVGDLVLLFNSKDQDSRARAKKLDDRWGGPYRVQAIPEDSTFYFLEELDGTHLAKTFAGNRLKKFFSRQDLLEDRILRERFLKEMDEAIEADQSQFAERHAGRLEELEQMAENARRQNIYEDVS